MPHSVSAARREVGAGADDQTERDARLEHVRFQKAVAHSTKLASIRSKYSGLSAQEEYAILIGEEKPFNKDIIEGLVEGFSKPIAMVHDTVALALDNRATNLWTDYAQDLAIARDSVEAGLITEEEYHSTRQQLIYSEVQSAIMDAATTPLDGPVEWIVTAAQIGQGAYEAGGITEELVGNTIGGFAFGLGLGYGFGAATSIRGPGGHSTPQLSLGDGSTRRLTAAESADLEGGGGGGLGRGMAG